MILSHAPVCCILTAILFTTPGDFLYYKFLAIGDNFMDHGMKSNKESPYRFFTLQSS